MSTKKEQVLKEKYGLTEEDYQGYIQWQEKLEANRYKAIKRRGLASLQFNQYEHPKIAEVKYNQVLEGEGLRCSLYVTGCPFACKNCYQKSLWNQNQGVEWTEDLEAELFDYLGKTYVSGITLVGGEPLLSAKLLTPLCKKIRQRFPDKTIWSYTGYLMEDVLKLKGTELYELVEQLDVLIDGQFITELRDETNLKSFRGSSNQRLIDVATSLRQGKVVICKD